MIFLFAAIDSLDPCSTSPCENGATCNQHANGNDTVYDCTCAPGWTSTHCDLGRSFLISLPCLRYMQTLTFACLRIFDECLFYFQISTNVLRPLVRTELHAKTKKQLTAVPVFQATLVPTVKQVRTFTNFCVLANALTIEKN